MGITDAVLGHVHREFASLRSRIDGFEKTVPTLVIGPPGEDGKDAEPISIERLTTALERNENGLRSVFDGLVQSAVGEHIKALPAPEPVIVTGPAGPAGSDGKDAVVDPEVLRAEVAKAVSELPIPKDGQDGAPGAPGANGRDGIDGKDGVGLAGAMQSKDGTLVLTLTNGEIRDVGQVAGRDGRDGERGEKGIDGKDGAPGLHGTLENLKIERLSERTIQFQFKDGTPVHGGTLRLDHPVWKNTWSPTERYDKSDVVQWSGGDWIALVDDPREKPGTGPPERTGWQMSIKPGSQGKTGPAGPPGPMGLKGDPGPQGKAGY